MTDKEINSAIAEACGWIAVCDGDGFWRAKDAVGNCTSQLWISERNVLNSGFPSYATDLNAIHAAEQWLDDKPMDTRSLYLDHLAVCLAWPNAKNAADLRFEVQYGSIRATARQKAEAFLRTIGKWRE